MEKGALGVIDHEDPKFQTSEMLVAGLSHVFGIDINGHDLNRIREREAKRLEAEKAAKRLTKANKVQPLPKEKGKRGVGYVVKKRRRWVNWRLYSLLKSGPP